MLTKKLIKLYQKIEFKRIQRLVITKGIQCNVYATDEELMPNNDPFNIEISVSNRMYAVNRTNANPVKRFIFFMKRSDILYHENDLLGDNVALRNDYIAFISNIDDTWKIGTIIEIDNIDGGRFVVHKVFKHRELSLVKRYLLSKEF